MQTRTDPVFGQVELFGHWYRDSTVRMFGKTWDVKLYVKGVGASESIFEEQRQVYRKYRESEDLVAASVKQAIEEFCKQNQISPKDAKSISPTGLIISMKASGNARLSFIFTCAWEPEDGVAVTIENDIPTICDAGLVF